MTGLDLVTAFATDIASRSGRVYFVGGYARDAELRKLGHAVTSKDIDLEVYGIDVDSLQEVLANYGTVNVVGASFGVFKLGQNIDVSIPRRDSKAGTGHTGFAVSADPSMSVAEAARRRDFTINSLAIDALSGELIDACNGLADLKTGVLRATDPELFGDDSLRVLRAMQLAARFNLRLSDDTIELCRHIDLHDLPPERIGEEWKKLLLKAEKPSIGLETARVTGVLDQLHPALAALEHTPQDHRWHAEGNVWEHTKLAIDQAAMIIRRDNLSDTEALEVMLAVLCHDIGKTSTTSVRDTGAIISYGHAQVGTEPTVAFLNQLALSNHYLEIVPKLVAEHMFPGLNHTPSDAALRRLAHRLYPATILQLLRVSEADQLGRISSKATDTSYLLDIADHAANLAIANSRPLPLILGRDLLQLGVQQGPAMGNLLNTLFDKQLAGDFSDHQTGMIYAQQLVNELNEKDPEDLRRS